MKKFFLKNEKGKKWLEDVLLTPAVLFQKRKNENQKNKKCWRKLEKKIFNLFFKFDEKLKKKIIDLPWKQSKINEKLTDDGRTDGPTNQPT